MLLLNHSVSTVSEETFNIKLEDGKVIEYKEWFNEKGKVIDAAIKDEGGSEIFDENLLQKIWNFVDSAAI